MPEYLVKPIMNTTSYSDEKKRCRRIATAQLKFTLTECVLHDRFCV